MQITRLRIAGFKSFSDPVDIAIEAGLTGIVGPNGCGKSNIVEALRWVMGESSARGLRGLEMDDVIFNGSAFRPPFDLAEVQLTLRALSSHPGLIGHAGEIEVGRRIGRGVGSVFRLNGREARARDVQLMFADATAGARSTAIVGQGQVAALVEARPDERRRWLEEAAGIGGLHGRRREAQAKLDAARATLERTAERRDDQRRRCEALRGQAADAQAYRTLQARLRYIERRRAAVEVSRLEASIAVAAETAAAARRKARAAADARADASAQQNGLAGDLCVRREASIALAAEAARLEERLAAAREAEAARARERAALEKEVAQLEAQRIAEAAAAQTTAVELAARLAEAARVEEIAVGARAESERHGQAALVARDFLTDAEAVLVRAAAERSGAEAAARSASMRASELAQAEEAARTALFGLPASVDRAPVASAEADLAARADALAEATGAHAQALLEVEAAQAALDRTTDAAAASAGEAEASRVLLAEAEAAARRSQERATADRLRRTELDRRRARILDRLGADRGQLERLRAQRVALDPEGLAARADAARERALAAARTAGARADAARAAAVTLAAAAGERATAQAAHDRLRAEADALRPLVPPLVGDPAIGRLAVPESHAAALDAALGDDLLLDLSDDAPSGWRALPGTVGPDPALPAEAVPLVANVTGVPRLERRLRQVGVVPAADAVRLQASLRPGQMLVSLEGGLWRWDGLVRQRDASSAEEGPTTRGAAALVHRRRLASLDAILDTIAARLVTAGAEELSARAADAHARSAAEGAVAASRAAASAASELFRSLEQASLKAADLAEAVGSAEERMAAASAELVESEADEPSDTPAAENGEASAAAAGERRIAFDAVSVRAQEAGREKERASEALARARRLAQERAEAVDTARSAVGQAERRHARLVTELASRDAALQVERGVLQARLHELERDRAKAAQEDVLLRAHAIAAAAACGTAERRAGAGRAADAAARASREESFRAMAEATSRAAALATEIGRLRSRAEAAAVVAAALGQRAGATTEHLAALPPSGDLALERLAAHAAETAGRAAQAARTVVETERAQRAVLEHLRVAELSEQAASQAQRTAEADARDLEASLAVAQATLAETDEAASTADEAAVERSDREAEPAALPARAGRLRAQRDRLGPVNLRAVEELAEGEAALAAADAEAHEIGDGVERLRRAVSTIDAEARARLRHAFEQVDRHFQTMFRRLFGGGRAHLRLTDLDDPLSAGLELEAMPPGKKLAHVSLLSGGEKSLAGLALVFAFFMDRSTPICVLDEVDAPLDDPNVDRLASLLVEVAAETGTRFLVVTHHPLTMGRMDRLYGITMVEKGVSRVVSVALTEALELRQAS